MEITQKRCEARNIPSKISIESISNSHHRNLAILVNKAATLSSLESQDKISKPKDPEVAGLCNVLERVNKESDKEPRLRFCPVPLNDAEHLEAIIPQQGLVPDLKEFSKLSTGFKTSFSKLFGSKQAKSTKLGDFDQFFTHFVNQVYRYSWCIPANSCPNVSDISLFDHMKVTAAIATCLYHYHKETSSLSEDGLESSGPQFCIVAGDVSSIQRYIFDIAHAAVGGGVARRLRARSMYVQLCSEVATHIILHKLGMPLTNVVMSSGGNFYILLPNLPRTIEAIKEFQEYADDWFLSELNGELALNLGYIVFGEEGFHNPGNGEGGFGNILRRLAAELGNRKHKCLSSCTVRSGKWQEKRFLASSSFEGLQACHSCRKFPATKENLCVHCHRDAITGSKLTRSTYIALYAQPNTGDIPVLGYSVDIESEPRRLKAEPYLVLKLNRVDTTDLLDVPAVTKYLATHIPKFGDCQFFNQAEPRHEAGVKSTDPATFECIAHRSKGDELLGFLKADVDRLGETFIFGLKRKSGNIDTLSRIAAMSRMLDLYFNGWIQHLTLTEFRNCYTVFSGGDDIFVVGPWSEIPKLAERVKNDLDRFAGNPNAVTLSAGVLLAKPDYPIANAAYDLDRILRLSKESGRQRITILGHTLVWSDWQIVREEWETLTSLVKSYEISSAFLYTLLVYGKMWRDYQAYVESKGQRGNVMGLCYHPLLSYNMARNLDRRKAPEFFEWAKALLEVRPGDKRQMTIMNNLDLIASLLIYGIRGGRE